MNNLKTFLPHFVATLVVGLIALIGGFVLAHGPAARAAMEKAGLLQETIGLHETVNYQGYLREQDGSLVTGIKNITARFYEDASGGEAIHSITYENVNVRDGIFNIVIGDDGTQIGELFAIVPLYIGISLNDEPELIPRERVHSVPSAIFAGLSAASLNAENAENATNAVNAIQAANATNAVNAVNATFATNAAAATTATTANGLASVKVDIFTLDNLDNNNDVSSLLPNGHRSFTDTSACLLTDVVFEDSTAAFCKIDGNEIKAGFESFCQGLCISWGE